MLIKQKEAQIGEICSSNKHIKHPLDTANESEGGSETDILSSSNCVGGVWRSCEADRKEKKKIQLQMGRDVAGLHVDKNSNTVNVNSNGTINGTIHGSQISLEIVESEDFGLDDHAAKGTVSDEGNEKQEHEPEQKSPKPQVQKLSDGKLDSLVKPASGSAVNQSIDTSFEPRSPSFEAEKEASYANHANGDKIIDSSEKYSPKSNDLYSPNTIGKSQQTHSPMVTRKLLHPIENKYHDDEDNWSLASSTATSVHSSRSRVTVPVAPSFKCMVRAERRKEFYTKLEEKHKGLEQEKLQYAARNKEEEAAAIKQLRKSMTYKANPVPSFYREGPPMKVELKKLPVTRAKSPNLSRRKSCGDVVLKTTPEEKGICARAPRHSIGGYKEFNRTPITAKSKDRSSVRNANGTPQQSKKTAGKSRPMTEQTSADHAVQS